MAWKMTSIWHNWKVRTMETHMPGTPLLIEEALLHAVPPERGPLIEGLGPRDLQYLRRMAKDLYSLMADPPVIR